MKRLAAKIVDRGPLTAKEAEVLRLLCEGYYRPEIAIKLHRTLSTVSSHIDHISAKLHARGATEIVVIAQQLGLVEIRLIQRSITLQTVILFYLALLQLAFPTPRRPLRAPTVAARLIKRESLS